MPGITSKLRDGCNCKEELITKNERLQTPLERDENAKWQRERRIVVMHLPWDDREGGLGVWKLVVA